jgi:glycosyltransferase involved in cell wall biosynthesis
MLVINDGSSDHTSDIVKEFADSDERIILFNRANIGIFRLSETYNFALDKARGKYIAILEGDDIWYSDKLERQLNAMEANDEYILAWGAAHQANVDLSLRLSQSPQTSDPMFGSFNNRPLGSMLNVLFFRNCVPALTMLIRKQSLQEIGGFHQGYGLPLVDLPTLQLLATRGYFYFDPKPLGSWRVYPNQTTKTYLAEIFEGFYALAIKNYSEFSKNSSLNFQVRIDQLKSHFNNTLIMAYSRSGRYKLLKRQYKPARKDYMKSLTLPGKSYVWRLRSVVGLFLSLFHLDVEFLARILGRSSYKNQEI